MLSSWENIFMYKAMQIHFWGNVENTRGSVEKIVLSFAKYMTKFKPIVASKDDITRKYDTGNIRFYNFRENKIKNKIYNKILGLGVFTFEELISIIETEKPAILHFHNRQNLVDEVMDRLSYRPKVITHYHRHFDRVFIPYAADLLIVVSEEIRKHVVNNTDTQKPICVLPNPLPELLLTVRRREVKNDVPTLIYAGGIHRHKGFYELLDAVKRLGVSENYKLLLAGSGLENYFSEIPQIVALGYLEADQYFSAVELADIVVMPSHCEPFGLVALEAMYLGKLLVASNSCGLSEFVDESCAILIEPKNSESLLNGLKRAIELIRSKDNTLKEMRENARERSKHFMPSTVTAKLELIYNRMLS
jgi:glycosyltransferase involved in cell wall biosynthesis